MANRMQTAVMGATGYSGFELTRFLSRHPRLHPPLLMRRAQEPGIVHLDDIYPHISGNGGRPLETFSWERLEEAGVELLFMATPHDMSRELIPEALRRGLRVVDLSGAWRLKQADHRAVYKFQDADPQVAAKLDETAVYGSPELHHDQVRQAQLVANPGCYATSVILALAPLTLRGMVDAGYGIVCDAKSGVSGAGKQPTPKTHFVEVADNLSAIRCLPTGTRARFWNSSDWTAGNCSSRRTCCRSRGASCPRSMCG